MAAAIPQFGLDYGYAGYPVAGRYAGAAGYAGASTDRLSYSRNTAEAAAGVGAAAAPAAVVPAPVAVAPAPLSLLTESRTANFGPLLGYRYGYLPSLSYAPGVQYLGLGYGHPLLPDPVHTLGVGVNGYNYGVRNVRLGYGNAYQL